MCVCVLVWGNVRSTSLRESNSSADSRSLFATRHAKATLYASAADTFSSVL